MHLVNSLSQGTHVGRELIESRRAMTNIPDDDFAIEIKKNLVHIAFIHDIVYQHK
jgi:hypothetical protein